MAHALSISLDSVAEDASMNSLEAWDSMGHLRIVLEIESSIGSDLSGEQVFGIDGVPDIADLLYT